MAEAAAQLKAGGLVVFPTETVYGLGADALNAAAATRIFSAKGRPANSPLIVHVSSLDQAKGFARKFSDIAERLARRFWPGPLSLIVERACSVPDVVTAGTDTVAIRCPAHPVALALIEAFRSGIAAPSANRSSCLPPVRACHARKGLDGRVEMILDAGPCPGGLESTVIDVRTDTIKVLRRGAISIDVLATEASIVDLSQSNARQPRDESQGVRWLHLVAPEHIGKRLRGRPQAARIGLVLRVAHLDLPADIPILSRRLPSSPTQYASQLYDALHELEDEGCGVVIVEALPAEAEWAALSDRLARLSSESIRRA